MTGLRPEETEILTNSNKMREINPDVITLGQAFRQNGYFSARAGKIYHYGNPSMIGTDGHDDPLTWDEKYNPIGMDRTQQEHITRYGRGRQKDNNLGNQHGLVGSGEQGYRSYRWKGGIENYRADRTKKR